MDTPQVTPELLAACLDPLVTAGPAAAVLGGAPDGGWWALGLHTPAPAAVLASMPMSRVDTGKRTRRALERAGLTMLELPELTDIDHFPDALAAQCSPGSHTSRVVRAVAAGHVTTG